MNLIGCCDCEGISEYDWQTGRDQQPFTHGQTKMGQIARKLHKALEVLQ